MPYYPSHQDSRLGIHQSSSPKTLHRTHNLRSAVWAFLLGGSCVAICGVISSLTRVIIVGTLLITPLITTNEPPSRIVLFVGGVVDPSQAHIHIHIHMHVYIHVQTKPNTTYDILLNTVYSIIKMYHKISDTENLSYITCNQWYDMIGHDTLAITYVVP